MFNSTITRRRILASMGASMGTSLGVLPGLTALPGDALAQVPPTWPNKPIRMVVPFPPGGGTDAVARPLSKVLSQALGQQVVIDNRGGAGGTLGADLVAKSAPDGGGRPPYDRAESISDASVRSGKGPDPRFNPGGISKRRRRESPTLAGKNLSGVFGGDQGCAGQVQLWFGGQWDLSPVVR